MKLVLPKMFQQFSIKEKNGLTLIVPLRSKYVWTDEELWFRSVILDADGSVVSVGFPKFFTFGERPDLDEKMVSDWSDAKIYVKLDGSLIIRSVYKGRVMFRTRGAFELPKVTQRGPLRDQVLQYVDMVCPELNDPEYMPDCSLLFEWTSSDHRIVLDYKNNALTPLASICHHDLSVYMLVESSLCLLSFEDWKLCVSQMKGIEGFVVSAGGHLTKVKTDEYVALHDFISKWKPSHCYEFLKDMVSQDSSLCGHEPLKTAYLRKLSEEYGLVLSPQNSVFLDNFIFDWIDAYNSYRDTFCILRSFVDEKLLLYVEKDGSSCVRGNLSLVSRAAFARNMKVNYFSKLTHIKESIVYKLLGSADAASDEKIFWSFFDKFNSELLKASAFTIESGEDVE